MSSKKVKTLLWTAGAVILANAVDRAFGISSMVGGMLSGGGKS